VLGGALSAVITYHNTENRPKGGLIQKLAISYQQQFIFRAHATFFRYQNHSYMVWL